MIRAEKIMFHAADGFAGNIFDRLKERKDLGYHLPFAKDRVTRRLQRRLSPATLGRGDTQKAEADGGMLHPPF
ncbi:MAG: hypothetical protein ACOX0K_00430 [Oscillospiraceae bacterium]|jgi:hypothetical protein